MPPREHYATRLRALEGRIERVCTRAHLIALFAEWCELQEWWMHQPHNAEALAILPRCLENAAWVRTQRMLLRARRLRADGKTEAALALWEEARARLRDDWEIFYRRVPVPDVGELYDRGPPARPP